MYFCTHPLNCRYHMDFWQGEFKWANMFIKVMAFTGGRVPLMHDCNDFIIWNSNQLF